jgi:hypothetical protein
LKSDNIKSPETMALRWKAMPWFYMEFARTVVPEAGQVALSV